MPNASDVAIRPRGIARGSASTTSSTPGDPLPDRRCRAHRVRLPIALLLVAIVTSSVPAGSASIDQWQSIGPYGGTVTAVAIDPIDADLQIAGGFAGLFRSTDGGDTWMRADGDLPDRDIGAATFAADGTLYVGTFASGVYRSTDGGASFSAVNTGIENVAVFALLAVDGRVWTGTAADGIFLSTDGGQSWEARSTGIEGLQVNDLLSRGGDALLTATGATGSPGGVFQTTDAGLTWTASSTGITNLNVSALAGKPDGSVLFAGTTRSEATGGVYRSTDGGQSWEASVFGLTNRNITELRVDVDDPDTIFAATQPLGTFTQSGLYRSTDAGLQWGLVTGDLGIIDVRTIAQRIDDGELLTGLAGQLSVRGGLYRSVDHQTWERSDHGLTVLRCGAIATNPDADGELLVGTVGSFREPGGAYRTLDLGESWEEHTSGGMPPSILTLTISPWNSTRRYAGTSSGAYRWNAIASSWQSTALVNRRVEDLLITAPAGGGEELWAATTTGLFWSNDQGETWEDRTSNMGAPSLKAVAIDAGAPEVVYAGSDTGGVFQSTDSGVVWQAANTNLGNLEIRDLAFDESGALLAATADGVYELDGASWIDRSDGLTSFDVRAFAIYRGERFVATAAGIYRSSTGPASSWQAANDGLLNLNTMAVHADTAQGRLRLFAGTDGGGIFGADEVLPVEIAAFESSAAPGRVELRFRTHSERDHLGFRVERRLVGEDRFTERTRALLVGGPEYRFVDEDAALAAGVRADYRLLAVARDGTEEMHGPYRVQVSPVAAAPAARLVAAPNPFRTSTVLTLPADVTTLRIFDASGRLVRRVDALEGVANWSWNGRDMHGRPAASGIYWIQIEQTAGAPVVPPARVVRLRAR